MVPVTLPHITTCCELQTKRRWINNTTNFFCHCCVHTTTIVNMLNSTPRWRSSSSYYSPLTVIFFIVRCFFLEETVRDLRLQLRNCSLLSKYSKYSVSQAPTEKSFTFFPGWKFKTNDVCRHIFMKYLVLPSTLYLFIYNLYKLDKYIEKNPYNIIPCHDYLHQGDRERAQVSNLLIGCRKKRSGK